MESHKRILGILYIISGALQLMGIILVLSLLSIILSFITDKIDADAQWVVQVIFPLARTILIVIVFMFTLPGIVGGIALLKKASWALTLLLILGCFKLFSFPFGTALGIYTIWIYAENNKVG